MLKAYNTIIAESNKTVTFQNKIYNGFYISYNNYETNLYNDIRTSLILGKAEKTFILNGDHTQEYKKLIKKGFTACINYFKQNIELINKYSDKI